MASSVHKSIEIRPDTATDDYSAATTAARRSSELKPLAPSAVVTPFAATSDADALQLKAVLDKIPSRIREEIF